LDVVRRVSFEIGCLIIIKISKNRRQGHYTLKLFKCLLSSFILGEIRLVFVPGKLDYKPENFREVSYKPLIKVAEPYKALGLCNVA
jgi:hypothetical protein